MRMELGHDSPRIGCSLWYCNVSMIASSDTHRTGFQRLLRLTTFPSSVAHCRVQVNPLPRHHETRYRIRNDKIEFHSKFARKLSYLEHPVLGSFFGILLCVMGKSTKGTGL